MVTMLLFFPSFSIKWGDPRSDLEKSMKKIEKVVEKP
jgi:hypothetical protein